MNQKIQPTLIKDVSVDHCIGSSDVMRIYNIITPFVTVQQLAEKINQIGKNYDHPVDVNSAGRCDWTMLLVAIARNNLPVVQWLLKERNANPNAGWYERPSPLAMACYIQNPKMVKVLLENGADPFAAHKLNISFKSATVEVYSFSDLSREYDVDELDLADCYNLTMLNTKHPLLHLLSGCVNGAPDDVADVKAKSKKALLKLQEEGRLHVGSDAMQILRLLMDYGVDYREEFFEFDCVKQALKSSEYLPHFLLILAAIKHDKGSPLSTFGCFYNNAKNSPLAMIFRYLPNSAIGDSPKLYDDVSVAKEESSRCSIM